MKKTKIIIAAILISTFFNLQAQQTSPRGAIGVTYSGLGDNHAFYWESLEGAGSYAGKGYFSVGISYVYPVTSKLDIESGIEYGRNKYKSVAAPTGAGEPATYNLTNKLITIPATVRLNFLRHFFFNTGLLLDINLENNNHLDNQTGVGAIIGLGAKYDFKQIPIGIFLNPYYKHHAILPFSFEKYHQRTDEAGFRFGIVYRL